MLLHALLAFQVSIVKSTVTLMGLHLYVVWCLVFLSYSLQYFFSFLYGYCFNDNMQLEGSILVKSIWCPGDILYLNGQNFLKIWEFPAISLLNILLTLLACISSPSSMPVSLKFGLLMESLSSFTALEFFD
jgi:hypothetical protein